MWLVGNKKKKVLDSSAVFSLTQVLQVLKYYRHMSVQSMRKVTCKQTNSTLYCLLYNIQMSSVIFVYCTE